MMEILDRAFRTFNWRRIDPVGQILRLDAEYRQRRHLEEMTIEQLRDIGLTRSDLRQVFRRG